MSELTPSAPPTDADTPARPVGLTERVNLLDALRGFALCGVFISNSFMWFSGRTLLPREQAQAQMAPLLEVVVGSLYQFFVNQKFITLFSFLFGLGFSIQMSRAEARGASIVPLYTRRLLILLGLGLTHLFAIWVGDILHTYAIVGLALLLFRSRSTRTVAIWAFGLLVVMPLLVPSILKYGPVLLHGAEAADEAAKARTAEEAGHRARLLAALSSDAFFTAQAGNGRYFLDTLIRPNKLLWMGLILSRFLFGLLAGRLLLLQDVEGRRALHRRILPWGLAVGLLLNGTGLVMQRLRTAGVYTPPDNVWMFLLNSSQEIGYVAMAAGYVSLFALLFQRERWRRVLGVLEPVGRMALSMYLLQSVISVCLYNGWGLGLIGQLPPSRVVAMALGIFAVQVVLSHWWLARFRFGPAEWLWRSLTYGRVQPMRLAAREGAAGAATS
ncbi:DUF418 domain-containing protein [Pyxidicoccus xibeiensis]|uniref:DUF418 domain-containing protein n=1 Tax=Pyxidicoccus xibeiensis TaxID=2906759 RepID=UPI0020A751B4|nr:DUF418 domain-containing protein [Pyxidicoccus xibeiensis]MCP3140723.1 DUF418 domain-containing protein [Pyxidicoccus xibeiensis]